MKTMKKLHVAVAVASLFAVGTSIAGSISQSGVTIAREVISRDASGVQKVRAPSVSFNFDNGPTANANSQQDFNVTLQLGGDGTPTWDAAQLPTYRTVAAYRRNNGNQVVSVGPLGYIGATANLVGIELLGVDRVSADTLRFRLRLVNNSASSYSLGDLQLAFNSVNPGTGTLVLTGGGLNAPVAGASPTATDYALVTTIANSANATTTTGSPGVTGSVIDGCGEPQRRVTVRSRNFIGSGDGVEGETAGFNVTNNGYIVFATALDVRIDKSVSSSINLPDRATDPVLSNASLTVFTGSFGTTTVMPLGSIRFRNVPSLDAFDTDIAGQYYKYRAQGTAPIDGDLSHPIGLQTDGDVDTGSLQIKIDSTNGFATGSAFRLANNPFCTNSGANLAGVTSSGVLSNSNLTSTVTFSHAQIVAAITGGSAGTLLTTTGLIVPGVGTATAPAAYSAASTDRVYLCYEVNGTDQIPQSQFTGTATLFKEGGAQEQGNQSCPNPLAGLGGGVKIDVRNFFPYNPALPNNQWVGVIRVINNSETQSADLTGQYIRADGKYGQWGGMGTLAPRQSRYFTSKEVYDLLVSASSLVGADNTGSGGLTATAGQALPANTRLRISSNQTSTLRVQSYIFNANTQALVEVSGAQGADFVNIETANNNTGVDSQDAQTGIKK
jgi:hypothetical protein